MTFDWELTIRGLQEAQRANERVIAALKPAGALGRAIQHMTGAAHRWAVYHTPWDYGALRASQRMKIKRGRGIIYIDPGATHPRSSKKPSEYGPILHKQGMIPGIRGGIRAFYAYTEQQHGDDILKEGAKMVEEALG